MPRKRLVALSIAALSVFATILLAAVLGIDRPAAAQEVSYPWCTQGSSLHCYYMSRQQCEETVDYRGFCVANPDFAPLRATTPKRQR
jgi:Protein of unknown function (DUF3551)